MNFSGPGARVSRHRRRGRQHCQRAGCLRDHDSRRRRARSARASARLPATPVGLRSRFRNMHFESRPLLAGFSSVLAELPVLSWPPNEALQPSPYPGHGALQRSSDRPPSASRSADGRVQFIGSPDLIWRWQWTRRPRWSVLGDRAYTHLHQHWRAFVVESQGRNPLPGQRAIHLCRIQNTCARSVLLRGVRQILIVPIASITLPPSLRCCRRRGFPPRPSGGATVWSSPVGLDIRTLGGSQAAAISGALSVDVPERFQILGYTCPHHLDPGDACDTFVDVGGTVPAEARPDVLLDGRIHPSVSLTCTPSPETVVR